MRGYNLSTSIAFLIDDYYLENEQGNVSYFVESDETEALNEESLFYFEKIVDFCEANQLQLILTRMSTNEEDWGDAAHNSVQILADENRLDFIDFNYSPFTEEIEYDAALDKDDDKHFNYYGAQKMTAWFGNYLSKECGLSYVRNDEAYSFMEDEKNYQRKVLLIELNGIEDLAKYLAVVDSYDDFTVLISVKDDGAFSLTEEQRNAFAALGLNELSLLAYRDSYVAVMESGGGRIEELRESEQESEKEKENSNEETVLFALNYSGKTEDGSFYSLQSASANFGNDCSCIIDGTEYSEKGRGINVVYDNILHEVLDSASFDTFNSSVREVEDFSQGYQELVKEGVEPTENMQKLYLAELNQNDVYTARKLKSEQAALQEWLNAFNKEGYCLMFSAQGDGISLLSKSDQEALTGVGLLGEGMDPDMAWGALLENGEVQEEEWDGEKVIIDTGEVCITSGGEISSIMVNNEEYSLMENGVNLVIYDTVTGLVVDSVVLREENIVEEVDSAA